jgi:hypothetical protein
MPSMALEEVGETMLRFERRMLEPFPEVEEV